MDKAVKVLLAAIGVAAVGFGIGYSVVWAYGGSIGYGFTRDQAKWYPVWAGIGVAVVGFVGAALLANEVIDERHPRR
jgi:hypothetical protein